MRRKKEQPGKKRPSRRQPPAKKGSKGTAVSPPQPDLLQNGPEHATTRPLRQQNILQSQQRHGNAFVQRSLSRNKDKQKRSSGVTEADESAALEKSGHDVTQESEEEMTVEQTVRSEQQKSDHKEHALKNETNADDNGHLDEWITESHTVKKSGSHYVVTINNLDLHTQVYIWPKATKGRWNKIEDFGKHFNKPYDPGFNIYEGTLKHEQQHVVEAVNAFKAHEAQFRSAVAKIKEPTKAAAAAKYRTLFTKFKKDYNTAYWANGETDGQRVEWEYYHGEYIVHVAGQLIEKAASGVKDMFSSFGF